MSEENEIKLETVEEFLARGGEITHCRPGGFPQHYGTPVTAKSKKGPRQKTTRKSRISTSKKYHI